MALAVLGALAALTGARPALGQTTYAGGLQGWVQALASGTPRASIIQAFFSPPSIRMEWAAT